IPSSPRPKPLARRDALPPMRSIPPASLSTMWSSCPNCPGNMALSDVEPKKPGGADPRARMIARAAREIAPGMVVNLGIGLPTRVVDHLPADMPVCLHTENGMTGIGPTRPYETADRNLIDAGGAYIS